MKATLVFAVFLFSAVAETYGDYRCPKFWTEFEGHCYRYCKLNSIYSFPQAFYYDNYQEFADFHFLPNVKIVKIMM